MVDLMLMKFIEHHQLFEFIDVYKVYLKKENRQLTPSAQTLGNKTFLHLAIENKCSQIASYLLLDANVDPNILSLNDQMSALHMAISAQSHDLIDLILMSE